MSFTMIKNNVKLIILLKALFAPMNCKRVYFSQELQVKLYYRVLFIIKPNAVTCELTPKVSRNKTYYISTNYFDQILNAAD